MAETAKAKAAALSRLVDQRNEHWAHNTEYFFAAIVGACTLLYIISEVRVRLIGSSTKTPWLQRTINVLKRIRLCSYKIPVIHSRVYAPIFLLWMLVLAFFATSFSVQTFNHNLKRIGARTGNVAAATLPPLFFLSMKNSPIALLVGSSHEKLNILHRWTGRTVVAITLVHTLVYVVAYAQTDTLYKLKRMDNVYGMLGFAAMLLLAASAISMARRKGYEIFYALHWVFTVLILVFSYLHVDATAVYVKVSAGIILADQLLRVIRVLLSNPYTKAEVEILNEDMVIVTVPRPAFGPMRQWIPGSHAFVNIASLQNAHQRHPFTICSLPEDGHIKFIIKKQRGFTQTLHKRQAGHVRCLIDGPYGALEMTRFSLYPSVLLIGGGVGITFILPILRSLLTRKSSVQSVVFAWSTNTASTFEYFQKELRSIQATHEASGSNVALKVLLAFTGADSNRTSVSSISKLDAAVQEKDPYSSEEVKLNYELKQSVLTTFHTIKQRICTAQVLQEALAGTERLAVGVCGPQRLILDMKRVVSQELAQTTKDLFFYSEEFDW